MRASGLRAAGEVLERKGAPDRPPPRRGRPTPSAAASSMIVFHSRKTRTCLPALRDRAAVLADIGRAELGHARGWQDSWARVEGRHWREGLDAVFEAKFMPPWSFSEKAPPKAHGARHVGDEVQICGLSIINGSDDWVEIAMPRGVEDESVVRLLILEVSTSRDRDDSGLPKSIHRNNISV